MSEGSAPIRFVGTDEATIDDKGRILISKKKRERLGQNFVIALSEAGVLAAYPERTWNKVCEEIESAPSTNMGRQQYARLVMGSAEDELNCDAQGRVVINQKLREIGKLADKVLLVGSLDRIEIWAKSEWDVYVQNPDEYGSERLNAIVKALGTMRAS